MPEDYFYATKNELTKKRIERKNMNSDIQLKNKRIAKNTLLLYIRTFFTLLINLYSSRVVLNALGVEDFGIYNVVGGVVGMFTLISGSMTTATQRFIAFELGKRNGDSNHVFSATLTIHIVIATIIILFGESFGLWFINEKLVIAQERMNVANWVYQFSLLTFVINVISIPYNGLIVAHERMDAFAFISIGEAILKLLCVLSLEYILMDSLFLYSFYMFAIAFIIRITYGIFCSRFFTDSKYHFFKKSPIYHQIISFTGWNFLGSTAGVLSNQGQNILINIFFGVIPNAARAIASQVDNALNQFVTNFTMALNPQITKSYAMGDKEYTLKLVSQGGKLCFFLFLCGAAPIMFCASEILEMWLKQVPEYSVLFLRLSFVYILLQTWSQTLYTIMLASGDIKLYQIIVGGTCLLSFPLTWFFFQLGYESEYSYYSLIIINSLCLMLRLVILQKKTGLIAWGYVKSVIFPCSIVSFCVYITSLSIIYLNTHWIISFILVLFSCLFFISLIGLSKTEHKFVLKYIRKKLVRNSLN